MLACRAALGRQRDAVGPALPVAVVAEAPHGGFPLRAVEANHPWAPRAVRRLLVLRGGQRHLLVHLLALRRSDIVVFEPFNIRVDHFGRILAAHGVARREPIVRACRPAVARVDALEIRAAKRRQNPPVVGAEGTRGGVDRHLQNVLAAPALPARPRGGSPTGSASATARDPCRVNRSTSRHGSTRERRPRRESRPCPIAPGRRRTRPAARASSRRAARRSRRTCCRHRRSGARHRDRRLRRGCRGTAAAPGRRRARRRQTPAVAFRCSGSSGRTRDLCIRVGAKDCGIAARRSARWRSRAVPEGLPRSGSGARTARASGR